MPAEPIPCDPRYVQGGLPGEVWAHFRSGVVVRAGRDRTRHYPGLESVAPVTLGFYLHFDQLGIPANHVIDAGCGAGAGLRHLAATYHRATGIDADASVLRFARELAPGSRFIAADLSTLQDKTTAQAAYLVDVLGQVTEPVRALLRIASHLDGSRSLCIAEPLVATNQCLAPPARRAFSTRTMHSLLTRAGFSLEQWLECSRDFLICYAVDRRDRTVDTLQAAEEHLGQGQLHVAELLARRVCQANAATLKYEALLTLARVQYQQALRDAATATLVEARQLEPTDPRAVAGLSLLAYAAGSDSQAFSLAREAVALDPTDLASVMALATLLHDAEPKQALAHWTVAHALAPDHPGIVARLCDAAVRLGDFPAAVAALEQSRRYDSAAHGVSGTLSLAWLLTRVGRYQQATTIVRRMALTTPNAPELKELCEFLEKQSPS